MNDLRTSLDLNNPEAVSVLDELPLWSAPFGLRLLDAIVLKKNISVLDIGFGLGFPLIEVASRIGATGKLYGIDPWKAATVRAKRKIEILGLKNITLIDGVAESVPLPDATIDLIISNNGINNVQGIGKVFRECARIAKPGAQFVMTVNLKETMTEFYTIFEQVLTESGLANAIPKLRHHIYLKRRPVEEFEKHFSENHFQITKTTYDSFRLRYADGSAMMRNPFIRWAFMGSWIDLVPSGKIEMVFAEIETRMNRISDEKGEWAVTIPLVLFDARKK